MEKFKNRFKKNIQRLCETLEMAVAVIVLVGIVMTIFSLLSDFEIFHAMLGDTAEFKPFLEEIFVIVIGIEFLQMLCRPNSDNVMEVLIFLVARHMIIGDTTPFEDFISVISVGLLCVLRRYLHVTKEKERDKEKNREGYSNNEKSVDGGSVLGYLQGKVKAYGKNSVPEEQDRVDTPRA